MIKEVYDMVKQHGDAALINDFLYNNYASSTSYFDDDLEKTAYFLDSLSSADVQDKFAYRTQNFEMQSMLFIPAYVFRKYCSGRPIERLEYPRIFRNLHDEKV